MPSYYEVLKVTPKASDAEIRKSYIALAKDLHPDKGGDKKKFQEIEQAYETLKDPNKRRIYDKTLPIDRSTESPSNATASPVVFATAQKISPAERTKRVYDAAKKGDISTLETLLPRGADPDLTPQYFNDVAPASPLFIAIMNNQVETAKWLLSKGANPNRIYHEADKEKSAWGETTYFAGNYTTNLIEAVKSGNLEIVTTLLECKDIDVNKKDCHRDKTLSNPRVEKSALQYAAELGNAGIVLAFLTEAHKAPTIEVLNTTITACKNPNIKEILEVYRSSNYSYSMFSGYKKKL